MHKLIDAIQNVTACVQNEIGSGRRSRMIDADDLVEVLLAIADRLEVADESDDDAPLAELAGIAKTELRIPTLETRGSDGLDFHDVGVAGLRAALVRAYRLGRDSRDP